MADPDGQLTAEERELYEAFFASKPGDPSWRNDPRVQAFLQKAPENEHTVDFLEWFRGQCPRETVFTGGKAEGTRTS